ncbi:hypothetical protein ACFW04_007321 [Cataglyphis niger]
MAHSHNDDTHACQSNNYAVCQTLDEMVFERGLWKAALDGDIERVERLLDRGHDPRQEDTSGYTPLHFAARHGHFEVCELLLNHGANVNAITPSIKATPLHRAATQGHVKTVETLLRHGANANLKDIDGKTALHRAISSYVSSMETPQNTSLSNTCMLLLPHTDPNIKDNTGRTIKELMESMEKGLDQLYIELQKMMSIKEKEELKKTSV